MRRGPLMAIGLLAALVAAGAWWVTPHFKTEAPTALHDGGIGPLIIDREFSQAKQAAFRAAPDSAFSGVGCAGLDEIRYDGRLNDNPVSIMAMADKGRIREVEAMLYSPSQAKNLEACLGLRDEFAKPFVARFGPFLQTWEVKKPVSHEFLAQTGPVVLAARWFAMGRSCYVSAHYGVLEEGSVRLGDALALRDTDT